MTDTYTIVLAHADSERRRHLRKVLSGLGHEVVREASSGPHLAHAVEECQPDLIVTSGLLGPETEQRASDTLRSLADSCPTPAILIAQQATIDQAEEALKDHVMAYMVEPVDSVELGVSIPLAVGRFREFQVLRGEVRSLQEALEDRKAIEQAKGLFMERYGITEKEAFQRLRKISNDKRRKIGHVARILMEAESYGDGAELQDGHIKRNAAGQANHSPDHPEEPLPSE